MEVLPILKEKVAFLSGKIKCVCVCVCVCGLTSLPTCLVVMDTANETCLQVSCTYSPTASSLARSRLS